MAAADDAEYLVDAGVGGQCTVKDGEVTLEALRDVVATATWLNHCRQELFFGGKIIFFILNRKETLKRNN